MRSVLAVTEKGRKSFCHNKDNENTSRREKRYLTNVLQVCPLMYFHVIVD